MTYAPRWNMVTTPHSGTRYVRDSFIDAGYVAQSTRRTKNHIDEKSDLMWGHCDRGHENWIEVVKETWPDCHHLLVVRDPIATLATTFRTQIPNSPGDIPTALRHIGDSLELHRRIQQHYIDNHSPHIHRVEDPIASLGDWAGVELKEGSERHSVPSPLQQAVVDRDLDRIFDIVKYGDLMEWFITEHSANLAPLYRDQLGYDFWWQNE